MLYSTHAKQVDEGFSVPRCSREAVCPRRWLWDDGGIPLDKVMIQREEYFMSVGAETWICVQSP